MLAKAKYRRVRSVRNTINAFKSDLMAQRLGYYMTMTITYCKYNSHKFI